MNDPQISIESIFTGARARPQQLRMCTRCLYDEDTPSIVFDDKGVCSYCHMYENLCAEYPSGEEGERRFRRIVGEIKEAGRGKKYDCVVGVSGGTDSSYMVFRALEFGLRPLAVHYDNTWNTATATMNIDRVLRKLDVDLYTIVVNNKEIDDVFRSFLKASVPDLDASTDIGLAATLYRAAEEYGVKYILEGHSFRTEGVAPLGWSYMDGRYIECIQAKFGTRKLVSFPNMPFWPFVKWTVVKQIRKIRPLWYLDYSKAEVRGFLQKEFGWEYYGGHHLENRISAFSHSFYLPTKFGMDQRKNAYSASVRTGEISREEGIRLLSQPPYLEPELFDYFLKRLGFTREEFAAIMALPRKSFRDYETYKKRFETLQPMFYMLYKANLVPRSFYIKYCFHAER